MRMPFEKLMERVAGVGPEEKALPLGVFAERWGEPVERIMDAIDAVRVTRGERTYISLTPTDQIRLSLARRNPEPSRHRQGDEALSPVRAPDDLNA